MSFFINQLLTAKKHFGRKWLDRQFSGLSTPEIFTKVYEEKYWQDNGSGLPYSSGTGSCEDLSKVYCQFVSNFVKIKKINSIVDLGCGDFQVSKQILDSCDVSYLGYDCVQKLVDYNQEKFGSGKINFSYANLVEDQLAGGDLCLIRQVLQHLSNQQISLILHKIKQYKYVIVTEHYPLSNSFTPNLDHQSGPRTRIYKNSAVVLDQPPFSVKNLTEVLSIEDHKYLHGYIKTFLISN